MRSPGVKRIPEAKRGFAPGTEKSGEIKSAMTTGAALLTFVIILLGISVLIALLCRIWPRYGSVTEAVQRSDDYLEQMEVSSTTH